METNDKLASKPEGPMNVPTRGGKPFRDRLLSRLPRLAAPSFDTKDVFDVHDSMVGLRDLGADALLEPLAPLAETRGE